MRVLGVDGCPGGWVGALVEVGPDGPVGLAWQAGDFAGMLARGADVVAVDIPIGLPAGAARRAADLQARALLGPQRSCVFLAPPRIVLQAGSQPQATALSRSVGSVGVSIQTWHILAKVAEVDALVRGLDERVVEVHPELSLHRLAGRRLSPKRTAAGRAERLAVLRSWLPGLHLPHPRPGRAAPEDCLDAVAAAWSGLRWGTGQAQVLGAERDQTGLPMRIAV